MDQSWRLLQTIVENGRMGADACAQLLNKCADENLRKELAREEKIYGEGADEAERLLRRIGVEPRPKGPVARMGLWMGMEMNTALDDSASHIAEITIEGATMGVVELTKARNSNPDANSEAQSLAAGLIARQQEAVDRLKAFLREKVVIE